MSPEVGQLDESAVDEALSDDPDAALSLIADLTGATDVALRQLAQQLAARLVLDLGQVGRIRTRGVGKIRSAPLSDVGGDLDLDASLEPLQLARATETAPALDELRVREWSKPDTAICLLIDRSGSMTGERLASAAVATAAAANRAPDDHAVVAFSDKAIVIKAQGQYRATDDVVNDVFRLRGFGPTDLALALRVASAQLASSSAQNKRVILLSDCRPTAGTEPELECGLIDELHVIAPADDCDDARHFANAVGALFAELTVPSGVPAAFAQLADG